jgi:hypothetical protein
MLGLEIFLLFVDHTPISKVLELVLGIRRFGGVGLLGVDGCTN